MTLLFTVTQTPLIWRATVRYSFYSVVYQFKQVT